MSSVYVLEPPTKGKVIITTTHGDLDIELWPKEAPKAVRNFVQLCLEGYYNGTVFHRLIQGFMIQGGDRSGTGKGGESIYGQPFADEFHSRLKFNHRGIVACANAGERNSNNSQFFVTLDKCDWLEKKNTIFGKVTGDTIYNLVRLGELETEEDDRPVDPPKIISVEVLWNPFDDIVPREDRFKSQKEEEEHAGAEAAKRKSKRKGTKNLALLSFGEEAAEEEEVAKVSHKIKSSHDLLDDPRLIKSTELDDDELQRRQDLKVSVRQALKKEQEKDDEAKGGSTRGAEPVAEDRVAADDASGSDADSDDDAGFDARMRRKILDKRKMLEAGRKAGGSKGNGSDARSNLQDEAQEEDNSDDEDDEEGSQTKKKDGFAMKKKGVGSVARAQLAAATNKDTELMTKGELAREQIKQRKRTNKGRENETLAMLEKFKTNLVQARLKPKECGKDVDDDDMKDGDPGWLRHRLKFAVDHFRRDPMQRNEDPNQYILHDPLLEKGKEKFNKQQQKRRRREREWGGGPGPQG